MTSHESLTDTHPTEGIDPRFVFDFQTYDDPADESQRWSTWYDVDPLCRGPEPRPDWVVTSRGALDTELGVLKTGKEADVFLLERADPHAPDGGVVMAAKRYRGEDHRDFHRSAGYTDGRKIRNTRDQRALARKSAHGRAVAAGQWAMAEWESLKRLWSLGLSVPYPVQLDGTELLMEWVTVDGETAPRLAQTRPERELLASYFDQVRDFMAELARQGMVHGDLSAYNILAAGERLVVIDLPQVIDLVANPSGGDFLLRDCTNVCRWFRARGLEVDEQVLLGELLAHAF
ncbi:serine protein kinase RIO [Nocardioides coralli]|uniref:serine protein kinase RIO n=1 Tax=Nocardioides coralli TaxID=2872154 RepID=UPI001CA3AFB0|nr:RIO1 family regulatory kinase/ATPase [Nocardioides coralli]QZY28109.1 serine/threonine protein kinase [Nocardioides coralli]